MRELLEAVRRGDVTPEEAEAQLVGYVTTEEGRYDATREKRHGVPEAILADGKNHDEVISLVMTALATVKRAIVTRIDENAVDAVYEAIDGERRFDYDERARTLVIDVEDFAPNDIDAAVGIVSAGTSDAAIAGEAAIIATEMGASVELIEDVGVANINRLLDQLDELRQIDVLVVAAGREGALPTVIAGLVDTPVIGLPVGTGYGMGGEGESALLSMLQSCTALSTVNVDAGFVAGAQAGLIAQSIARARASR